MVASPQARSALVHDVAIIGAGPAGLAAALSLRQNAPRRSVCVVGAGDGAKRKLGETFPPGAQAILRSLGVWDAFLASDPMPAYGTCAAWGGSRIEDNEFIFHPDRRGWHVQREPFDAILAREAGRQAVALHADTTLVDPRWHQDHWQLVVRHGGRRRILAARFVIDATGRTARFAERVGANRFVDDRLVATAVQFTLPASAPVHDTYSLVEACIDGWWYSARQPDGRMAVAMFTDADIARRLQLKDPAGFQLALEAAPHTRARVAAAVVNEPPVARLADSGLLDRITGPNWLATGDAASTFDPLSSQGVMKALRQGTIAGYAVTDHLAGDPTALPKYESLLQREYREFLAVKRDFYRRETRWTDAPFWSRRHGSNVPMVAAAREVA